MISSKIIPPPYLSDGEKYLDPQVFVPLCLSSDARSVSNNIPDKSFIYGNIGFTRGVHYWEYQLEYFCNEQEKDNVTIFLGVAEKPPTYYYDNASGQYLYPPPIPDNLDKNLATNSEGKSISLSPEQVKVKGDNGVRSKTGTSRKTRAWRGYGFVNNRRKYEATEDGGISIISDGGGLASRGSTYMMESMSMYGRRRHPHLKVYGESFQVGDLIGVKLDLEVGVLSFFINGMKFGSHTMSDLGPAFTNMNGGGDPSSTPRVLYPVVGLRKHGDRVSITRRWFSRPPSPPSAGLEDAIYFGSLVNIWSQSSDILQKEENRIVRTSQNHFKMEDPPNDSNDKICVPSYLFPPRFLEEGFTELMNWQQTRWQRINTRAQSRVGIDVDTSIEACVKASLLLGLRAPLFPGDKIRLPKFFGNKLDRASQSINVILGAYRGLLWYQPEVESAGQSTSITGAGVPTGDGTNAPWCFLPCDINGHEVISRGVSEITTLEPHQRRPEFQGRPPYLSEEIFKSVPLPQLPIHKGRFLRVTYSSVVVRDDLEIDNTNTIGTIEEGTIVEAVERIICSANVARYRIKYPLDQDEKGKDSKTRKMDTEKTYTYGWISEKLRGDVEDLVVIPVELIAQPLSDNAQESQSKSKQNKGEKRASIWKDIKGDPVSILSTGWISLNYEELCEKYTTSWLEEVKKVYYMEPNLDNLRSNSLLDLPREFSRSRKNTMDITADENIDDKVSNTQRKLQQITPPEFGALASGLAGKGTSVNGSVKWTLAMDIDLIELMNDTADRQSVLPSNISLSRFIRYVLQLQEVQEDSPNLEQIKKARAKYFSLFNGYSKSMSHEIPILELVCRVCLLRVLNTYGRKALPLIAMSPTIKLEPFTKATFGSNTSSTSGGISLYLPSSYTASRLRCLRKLLFLHTKSMLWESILEATTTPTPPAEEGEFGDPEKLVKITINRIQAKPELLASIPSSRMMERLDKSVLGQLYSQLRRKSTSDFRRAYLGKGHGGQKRAFKVKLLQEGGDDYGGPYRAIFEHIIEELQNDVTSAASIVNSRNGSEWQNVEGDGYAKECLLPLLAPCPNRKSGIGSNRDKYTLNTSLFESKAGSDSLALYYDLCKFVGIVLGLAVRHSIPLGLDLASCIWKPLVSHPLNFKDLKEIDLMSSNIIENVEKLGMEAERQRLHIQSPNMTLPGIDMEDLPHLPDFYDLSWITTDPIKKEEMEMESKVDTITQNPNMNLTVTTWRKWINAYLCYSLLVSQKPMSYLREGFSQILPSEYFSLFTESEMESIVCGERKLDVRMLQQYTDYEEGVDPKAEYIQFFWEVLNEMSEEEKTDFLRFSWARSRMPASGTGLPTHFKIHNYKLSGNANPDFFLPRARTCFFILELPAYSSKQILREKLIYAMYNSPNMDLDFIEHDASAYR